ncbi:MAG TPA: 50S ribosomal protein L10 [Pyrinomonadaceae bacterium]|jgi:large subunit ribosomal protein L10|nr:50S ribosomal protein L10 [Pyrinomonadaceae bacterium]
MKTRETKQKDLNALTESLANSKSAMVVSFSGVTVTKDQEFRTSLREAGAEYQVVKNTLARIAVKGTQFEDVSDSLKGVTAIAWTDNDPVVLSKAISKFMKDNADIYTFKTGVVDGRLVDLKQLTTIANLPSKEELISKLLWVLNSSAQRLVTVINAVPRNLAVVVDQIGKQEGRVAGTAAAVEAAPAEEIPAVPDAEAADDAAAEVVAEPQTEETTEAQAEAAADAPADAAQEVLEPREQAQSPDDKAEEALDAPAEPAAD